jgi:hypothetical protein
MVSSGRDCTFFSWPTGIQSHVAHHTSRVNQGKRILTFHCIISSWPKWSHVFKNVSHQVEIVPSLADPLVSKTMWHTIQAGSTKADLFSRTTASTLVILEYTTNVAPSLLFDYYQCSIFVTLEGTANAAPSMFERILWFSYNNLQIHFCRRPWRFKIEQKTIQSSGVKDGFHTWRFKSNVKHSNVSF